MDLPLILAAKTQNSHRCPFFRQIECPPQWPLGRALPADMRSNRPSMMIAGGK